MTSRLVKKSPPVEWNIYRCNNSHNPTKYINKYEQDLKELKQKIRKEQNSKVLMMKISEK